MDSGRVQPGGDIMSVGITIDKDTASAVKDLFKTAPKYLQNALNDTIRGMKTDVLGTKIGVRTELNVARKKVIDATVMKTATRSNLMASIGERSIYIPAYDKTKAWKIKGQKPGLHFQGRRKNRKGIRTPAFQYSFVFKKGKGRKTFDGAFMAPMKSGHTGLFIRTGSSGSIKEIFSSTVMDVFSNKEIMEPILKSGSVRFNKAIDKQISRIFKGK